MMPRKLSADVVDSVWTQLDQRLRSACGPDPGGYPDHFEDRLEVAAEYLPDELFLAAIRAAMVRVGDEAAYFLVSEYPEGDADRGLEWEVRLAQLTVGTLAAISPGLECYLYSPHDRWAIYFHHEGIAYCGGTSDFVHALRTALESR